MLSPFPSSAPENTRAAPPSIKLGARRSYCFLELDSRASLSLKETATLYCPDPHRCHLGNPHPPRPDGTRATVPGGQPPHPPCVRLGPPRGRRDGNPIDGIPGELPSWPCVRLDPHGRSGPASLPTVPPLKTSLLLRSKEPEETRTVAPHLSSHVSLYPVRLRDTTRNP